MVRGSNPEEQNVAAAADKSRKDAAKDDAAEKPRRSLLAPILIAVVAAAAAGGGVWYYTKSHADAGATPKSAAAKPLGATPAPAQYFALDPAFVVNINGPVDGPRYLQVEVQLMTRDPEVLATLEAQSPGIRARLLMLFSQVQPEQIADRAGKEKLQQAALAEVQKLMKAETGKESVDDLLFTSFVTQ